MNALMDVRSSFAPHSSDKDNCIRRHHRHHQSTSRAKVPGEVQPNPGSSCPPERRSRQHGYVYRTKPHRVEAPATSKVPTSSRKTSVSATPSPITYITSTSIMFRTALTRSARCIAQASARTQQPAVRRAIVSPFVSSTRITVPAISIAGVRCYAGSSGLAQEEVTGRIMDLLKNFDKVSIGYRGIGPREEKIGANAFSCR